MAHGRAHEAAVVAGLTYAEPSYPVRDHEAGARATRALMENGADLIYQGVLVAPDRVGKPDLLRRNGSGGYVVGDVKASASPKVEHAMQVAFYADLLARSDAHAARQGFLLLGDGREAVVDLDEVEPLYRDALEHVDAMRDRRTTPRPSLGPWCSGCQWRGVCLPEMEERGDLSLVVGVTPARREALEAAGVRSVAELADIDPIRIAERTELPRETLKRLRLQAASLLDGAPRRLGPFPFDGARIALSAGIARHPSSPHAAEFLAYRTERTRDALQETWIHESAAEARDEGRAYRRFLAALAADRDAPIYHFGSVFPDALSALDARWGRLGDPLPSIFARLLDVHAGLRSALVLPVRRYDLPTVARALDAEPASPEPTPDDETVTPELRQRRELAGEVLRIRRVRVAAQRTWKETGAQKETTDREAAAKSSSAAAAAER